MKYLMFLSLLFSASTVFSVIPHAYVTDQLGGSVRVIDISNDTVQTIFGFVHPRVVKVSADGTLAYVGCDDNTIRVIDTITNTVLPNIIPVNHAVALALTPNCNCMYVACADNTVTVVSTADYSVMSVIPGLNHPQDVKVRPDGKYVYVTNAGNGTISVIHPSTHHIVGTISGFQTPIGLTFTTDGQYAYVTDTSHNAVYVLRTSDNTIIDVILGFNKPSYIAVGSDREFAFISNTGNDTLSVVRTSDNRIVHTVHIPDPKSIAVTQEGDYLYVGSGRGEVFKIRTLDYAIITAIPNFQNPSNITLTTNNAPGDTVNACQVTFSPTETFNRVTWKAAAGSPIGYNIYRDLDLTQLIVSLPPTTFTYKDEHRQVGQTYTYYMTAEYANGYSCTIGEVTVTHARACRDL